MTKQKILKLINDYLKTDDIMVINELKRGIEQDIRDENNKKAGTADFAKAFKAICKRSENPGFKLPWVDVNGFTVATNGWQLIVTSQPVETELGSGDLNWKKYQIEPGNTDYESYSVPDYGVIKSEIALQKAEGKKLQMTELKTESGNVITVNAQYLLEMIPLFKNGTMKLHQSSETAAIHFTSKDFETYGILLPIRVRK